MTFLCEYSARRRLQLAYISIWILLGDSQQTEDLSRDHTQLSFLSLSASEIKEIWDQSCKVKFSWERDRFNAFPRHIVFILKSSGLKITIRLQWGYICCRQYNILSPWGLIVCKPFLSCSLNLFDHVLKCIWFLYLISSVFSQCEPNPNTNCKSNGEKKIALFFPKSFSLTVINNESKRTQKVALEPLQGRRQCFSQLLLIVCLHTAPSSISLECSQPCCSIELIHSLHSPC